jgi:hypothetical protein
MVHFKCTAWKALFFFKKAKPFAHNFKNVSAFVFLLLSRTSSSHTRTYTLTYIYPLPVATPAAINKITSS